MGHYGQIEGHSRIADQESLEGEEIFLNFVLENPGGGPTTVNVDGLPPGIGYQPDVQQITGIISEGAANNSPYEVIVTVSSDGFTDTATFQWVVNRFEIMNPGPQSNQEGDQVTLGIHSSPDDIDLTWAAQGLPNGLTINTQTGTISGTIADFVGNSSPYTVEVTATEIGTNESKNVSFEWQVYYLTLANPGDQHSVVGTPVTLQLLATSPDNNPLTFDASDLPDGLTLNTSSGQITGTLAASASLSSPYSISFSVTDGSHTAWADITWVVDAIALVNPGTRYSAEGESVTLQIVASAPGGGTLSYAASPLPTGLTIDSSTGVISGIVGATAADGSPYQTTVTASVGGASATAQFGWWISNNSLQLTNPGFQTTTAGTTLSLQVEASDPNNHPLRYSALGLPPGLQIQEATGVISGTVHPIGVGVHGVSLWVDNGVGNSAVAHFSWEVTYANVAPVLEPIGDQEDLVGREINLSLVASDANSDPITYSSTTLPDGLSLDSNSGLISGTLAAGTEAGSPYTITVTASDGALSDSETFLWKVSRITLENPGNQQNSEGDSVLLFLSASGASGATFTFGANNLPTGLTLDTSDGSITGSLANLSGNNSPYQVTVSVTDGTATAEQTFTWEVTHILLTIPPDQVNTQGDNVSLSLFATDPDDDTLTWNVSGFPLGLTFSATDTTITGTISSTAAANSPYQVGITVSDGSHSVHGSFKWTVRGLRLTPTEDQANNPGDVVTIEIDAEDGNGRSLTYQAAGLPTGLGIDPSTGVISGTIALNAARTQPYQVSISVTNGVETASDSLLWKVADLLITDPTAVRIIEGVPVSVQVMVQATLNDPITYAASGLPTGLSIGSSSGIISGTPAAGTARPAPYLSTVTASQGGLLADRTVYWTVENLTLDNPGTQTNSEGEYASLTLVAHPRSGIDLTFAATGLPPGLSIDSSGTISGTISEGAAANSPYEVEASVSAVGGTAGASQTFTWNVRSFAVSNPGPQENKEGDNITLQVTANPTGSLPLTWSAEGLPPGLTMNTAGLITGTVAALAANGSPYQVTVRASDGNTSDHKSFFWKITYLKVTNPGDQEKLAGTTIHLPIIASAPGGEAITYSAAGLPPGLAIDGTTGIIAGTLATPAQARALYPVTVTVAASGHTVDVEFDWTVYRLRLTNPGTQLNAPGDTVTLTLQAEGMAQPAMTFEASPLPTGLSINASTGVISGVVDSSAAANSPYTVTARVTQGTVTASTSFEWRISNGTVTLYNPGDQRNPQGSSIGLQLTTNAPAGATLQFAAQGLPAGLSLGVTTGLIYGTITAAPAAYTVTLWVQDSQGNSDSKQFVWTVTPVNVAPDVVNPGAQLSRDGAYVTLAVSASDGNNDPLTFTAAGLPPGLTINATTGVISGTLTNATLNSPYSVTVSASDGKLSDSETFAWAVRRLDLANPGNQRNREGDNISLTLDADASPGATLVYAAQNLPLGLTLDEESGQISGTIAEFASNNSPYAVTVSVADGPLSASQDFSWVITYIDIDNPGDQWSLEGTEVGLQVSASTANDDPLLFAAVGLPPGLDIEETSGVIYGTILEGAADDSPYQVTVGVAAGGHFASVDFLWEVDVFQLVNPGMQVNSPGDLVSLPLEVIGPEDLTLTFSAEGLPPGLGIDPFSGVIAGTVDATAADGSPYEVTVEATTGTLGDSVTFDWFIDNGGIAILGPADQLNEVGDDVLLQVLIDGAGEDPLTYSASGLPAGVLLDASTGEIFGTLAEETEGIYGVSLFVENTEGESGSHQFTWTVIQPNRPPVLVNPGEQNGWLGQEVALEIAAEDPDDDPLTYSALGLPPDLSIDFETGVISGTIDLTADTTAPYQVTVTVSDGTAEASVQFEWYVTEEEEEDEEDNDSALALSKQTLDEGESTTLMGQLIESDPDSDHLVIIEWGDESPNDAVYLPPGETTYSAQHTYRDDGLPQYDEQEQRIPGNGTIADIHVITATVIPLLFPLDRWTNQTQVEVNNVAPAGLTLEFAHPQDGLVIDKEGELIFEGKLTDPGVEDFQILTVDWGDGSAPEVVEQLLEGGRYRSIHHKYQRVSLPPWSAPEDTEYVVRITAHDDDDDGSILEKEKTVTVRSYPPELEGNPYGWAAAAEGQPMTWVGRVAFAGNHSWTTALLEWGDGTSQVVPISATASFEGTHIYANNLPWNGVGAQPGYQVTVTAVATGYEDHPLSMTGTVVVDNVLPSELNLDLTLMPNAGQVSLTGSFADPGTLDAHRVLIDWGDGAQDVVELPAGVLTFPLPTMPPVLHTFAGPAPTDAGFRILVRVLDDHHTDATHAAGEIDYGKRLTSNILTTYGSDALVLANGGGGVFEYFYNIGNRILEMGYNKAKDFVDGVGDFFGQLAALETQLGQISQDLPRVLEAFLRNPGGFVSALMSGAAAGFEEFFLNLGENVKEVLLKWLSRKLGDLGIGPEDFPTNLVQDGAVNWSALGGFVLKVMGLGWDDLVARAGQHLGEHNVAMILKAYDFVSSAIEQGEEGIFAAVANLSSQLEGWTDKLDARALVEAGLEAALKYVVEEVPGVVLTQVAKWINPAAGSIVALYQAANWFVDNASTILDTARRLTSALVAMGEGTLPPEGLKTAVVEGLKLASLVILDFAGKQVGMDRLVKGVVGPFQALRGKVDEVVDKFMKAIASKAKTLIKNVWPSGVGKEDDYNGLTGDILTWKIDAETHRLWGLAQAKGGKFRVMLASDPDEAINSLRTWKKFAERTQDGDLLKLVNKAIDMYENTLSPAADKVQKSVAKLADLRPNSGGKKKQYTNEMKVLLAETSKYKTLHTSFEKLLQPAMVDYYKKACFAAGTPIRTPSGWQTIESLVPGDKVMTRSDTSVDAPVIVRQVEEVFVHQARVIHAHVGGQVIRTTPEHPFWVKDRGWVAVSELRCGDQLATETGEWQAIEEVYDTGVVEPVYNVRVAECHTYFVGHDQWGFSVWAHNTCYIIKVSPTGLAQIFEGDKKDPVAKARSVGSLERAVYYLANLQASQAGFNRVLADLRVVISKSTDAAVRAVKIKGAASERQDILSRGTAAWQAAAYAIGHTDSGHGNDYRVANAYDAQQLLWDAYDATTYGRLPLRRPGTDEWQSGQYLFGYHFDTDYEGDPSTNAYHNNLQHIKWRDPRTDGGHTPADGHIYYGTWNGPHQYTQPPQGW